MYVNELRKEGRDEDVMKREEGRGRKEGRKEGRKKRGKRDKGRWRE